MNSKLTAYREQILKLAEQHRARNIRVFGSQIRDEDTENSDVDLLVDFEESDLFNRIGLQQEIEDLLGLKVDLLTERILHPAFRETILREARPL